MGLNRYTQTRPGYEPTVDDFSFVISDGTRKTNDREVQRKIRANAMRDYWRRRKLETKSIPDHGSTQSCNVGFETSCGDLGFDGSERIWWREGGVVEAGLEAKDCSSRYAAKRVAAECHLLLPHPATQSAHATPSQRRDTSKHRENEGESRNGSSIAALSIRMGNSMSDPFNASALEISRHDSFLLSHRKYLSSYAMSQTGQSMYLARM